MSLSSPVTVDSSCSSRHRAIVVAEGACPLQLKSHDPAEVEPLELQIAAVALGEIADVEGAIPSCAPTLW